MAGPARRHQLATDLGPPWPPDLICRRTTKRAASGERLLPCRGAGPPVRQGFFIRPPRLIATGAAASNDGAIQLTGSWMFGPRRRARRRSRDRRTSHVIRSAKTAGGAGVLDRRRPTNDARTILLHRLLRTDIAGLRLPFMPGDARGPSGPPCPGGERSTAHDSAARAGRPGQQRRPRNTFLCIVPYRSQSNTCCGIPGDPGRRQFQLEAPDSSTFGRVWTPLLGCAKSPTSMSRKNQIGIDRSSAPSHVFVIIVIVP